MFWQCMGQKMCNLVKTRIVTFICMGSRHEGWKRETSISNQYKKDIHNTQISIIGAFPN